MKLGFLAAAATVGICFASPVLAEEAEQDDTGVLEFNVLGDDFELAIPEGYCVPEGEKKAFSIRVAAMDSVNQTPVDLQKCGTYGQSYILIKSPYALPRFEQSKTELMAMLRNAMGSDAAKKIMNKAGADAQEDISEKTGGKLGVSNTGINVDGSDDDCVYLSSTFDLESPNGKKQLRVGSCMTFVGPRQLVVHSYEDAASGVSFDTLRARSRDLANSIVVAE